MGPRKAFSPVLGRQERHTARGALGLGDVEEGDHQAGASADARLAAEHRGERGAQAEAHRARVLHHVL